MRWKEGERGRDHLHGENVREKGKAARSWRTRRRERERNRREFLSPERTAEADVARTRGYRGTEETDPRLNMIIEHAENDVNIAPCKYP